MVFTTGSKSNPTRVLIPVSKILKVVENPPIKDRYEDYQVGGFDFHEDGKRYYTKIESRFNRKVICVQNLDERDMPERDESNWKYLDQSNEEYRRIFEEQKKKTYPEWKSKMADIYCPSSVYLDSAGVDGKDVIHVFETVEDILDGAHDANSF